MKRFIKIVLSLTGRFLTILLNFKLLFKIYNIIFNRSPYWLVKIFVKYVGLPDKDLIWDILLINKKKIKTCIIKDNVKTAEFALSYRWHSPALNFTEYVLNSYYDKTLLWVDVGSNLGLRSLLALSERKKVFFIEPNKELNVINRERCELNNFLNYTFFELGASDKQGEVQFFIDKTSYNSSVEADAFEKGDITRTELIGIDTLDNLPGLQTSDSMNICIKIDVEGHELNVLNGAKAVIGRFSPTMIIEVNEKGKHFGQFLELMTSLDYEVFEIGRFGNKKYFRKVRSESLHLNDKLKFNDFLTVKDKSLVRVIEKYLLSV
jgi:FkbM family methyltransferase